LGGSYYMAEQGLPAQGVQDLGDIGPHARALAGGEDDDTEIHG
jgi:hypothetical protein